MFQEEKLACKYLWILQGGLRFNMTFKVCTFIVKVVAIVCFIVTAERKSRVLCCLSYQVSEASFFHFLEIYRRNFTKKNLQIEAGR